MRFEAYANGESISKSKSVEGVGIKPPTSYSVVRVNGGTVVPICNIPDYFTNPKGIANGIARALNKAGIDFNLSI